MKTVPVFGGGSGISGIAARIQGLSNLDETLRVLLFQVAVSCLWNFDVFLLDKTLTWKCGIG